MPATGTSSRSTLPVAARTCSLRNSIEVSFPKPDRLLPSQTPGTAKLCAMRFETSCRSAGDVLEHFHYLRRPILDSAARVPLALRGARLRRAASTSGRRCFWPSARGRRIRFPIYTFTENVLTSSYIKFHSVWSAATEPIRATVAPKYSETSAPSLSRLCECGLAAKWDPVHKRRRQARRASDPVAQSDPVSTLRCEVS